MQTLLKLLAHIGKAFGISSPSDNARRSQADQRPPSKQSNPSSSESPEHTKGL